MTIQSTASFDLNGMYDFTENQLVLNGGLAYSSVDYQWGHGIFSDVALGADSESRLLHMLAKQYKELALDLGGKTLKVTGEGSPYLFGNVTATSGRVLVEDGTRIVFDKTGIRAPETAFELNGPMTVNVPSDVGDLLLSCPDAGYLGSEVVKVHGTFAPLAGTFPNVQMLDRSTIDLSSRTTTLPCVSVEADTTFTCSFADNAMITVLTGSRHLDNGEFLLSWETPPTGTSFKLPPGVRGELVACEKGLVYYCGLLIIVR